MRKYLLLLLALTSLLIIFGGCAKKLYYHPTKNAQDFERDKYECEARANIIAGQWKSGGMPNPLIFMDEMDRCLRIKYGWKLQSD